MVRRAIPLILLAGAVVACDHTSPFVTGTPMNVGPSSQTYPRRLTFNLGDDRDPAVRGDTLVYSRLDPEHSLVDRCLALLPTDGGTIMAEACPPLDTNAVNAWLEPALSPDGSQIAFLWQRGSPITAAPGADTLVVAPADDPGHPTYLRKLDSLDASRGIGLLYPQKPTWVNDHTVRFLYSTFVITYVKTGTPRFADTTIQAASLVDLDVTTGAITDVPGTQHAWTYAQAPDGGVWFTVFDSTHTTTVNTATLLHAAPGSTIPDTLGTFTAPVMDLANVGGVPVALLQDAQTVEALDLATGGTSVVKVLATPARRIAGAPGGRFVTAQDVTAAPPYGDRANLWLYQLR